MSRRKQANPRAVKREEEWGERQEQDKDSKDSCCLAGVELADTDLQDALLASPPSPGSLASPPHGAASIGVPADTENSLESGNSSRLELLIEKIQANKENNTVTEQDIKDALGTDPSSSWRSETPDDQTSPSPSSCATPNSASELPDAELTFTVGVTEGTPYACQFCDKAFPRLSYLKRHEQSHSDQMPFRCDFCSRLFKHKRSRDRHIKLHTGDKKYRCTHCEAAFSRSDHLKIHMKTHDNQKPFQCTVCNRGYNTAAALTSHMQNHKKEQQQQQQQNGRNSSNSSNSSSPGGLRCLQCGDSFHRPEDLQVHMASQHGTDSVQSPVAASSLLEGLVLSAPLVFPSAKLACIYCTKDSFTTMEALQLHVQAMHGSILNGEYGGGGGGGSPQHSCELCTMHFSTAQGLLKHSATVHGLPTSPSKQPGASPLLCTHCSLPFFSAALFAEHYLLVHGSSSAPEQLKPTDLSSKSSRRGLDRSPAAKRPREGADTPAPEPSPSLTHQYDQPGTLLCNQCGAALPDFESFRSHLKSHLEEAGLLGGGGGDQQQPAPGAVSPQQHGCPHCGAKLPSAEALEQHAASHLLATATEYGCPSCLKLFAKPDELQKHLMDIHAHHLYRCSLCREMFDSKVAIQVHFAVKHSNECKLYRCTACPAAAAAVFRTEADFTVHARCSHPLVQQHQALRCVFCRLGFSSELELQFHLAVHAKQFHCPVCKEGFHVEFLLDKHIQTHHASQVINTCPSNGVDAPGQQQKSPKSKSSSAGTQNGGGDCERTDVAGEPEAAPHRRPAHQAKSSTGGGAVSLHCAYCSENCKSRTELENHMKSHSQGAGCGGGPGKHKCNICDEMCPSAAVLAEHKLTHCKVVSGNTCTQCKASLSSEEQFFSHLQQHAGGTGTCLPAPCVVCRQTLVSDIEARLHATFHLQGPGEQCCLCLKRCELVQHRVNGGPRPAYICQDCYQRKTSPAARELAFRCSECQVKFETSASLETHLVSVHRKTYQCIKCQVSFETEQEIQLHVASHLVTEGSSHECHLCRRLLATPLKLQAHLIEHTFAGCGSYTCYLCSAVFTAAQGLQQHMLEHGLSARPYDCSRCSLRFFFRAELDNHSYSHLHLEDTKAAFYQHLGSNGSFESPPAELQLYRALGPDLSKAHKQSKVKGSSLRCAECGKEFSSAAGLQAHQRHHAGRQPCACPDCGRQFPSPRSLSAHSRAHHVKHEPEEDAAPEEEVKPSLAADLQVPSVAATAVTAAGEPQAPAGDDHVDNPC